MSMLDVPLRLPRPLILAAILTLTATACSSGAADRSAEPGASDTATPAASGSPAPSGSAGPSSGTMHLVPPTVVPGTVGALKDVVDGAVADAASRAGVAPSEVTVVSSEARDWPNAALGCPQRGVMYIDVITPGYQVIVEAGGTRYDYRASAKNGSVRLCENPLTNGGG